MLYNSFNLTGRHSTLLFGQPAKKGRDLPVTKETKHPVQHPDGTPQKDARGRQVYVEDSEVEYTDPGKGPTGTIGRTRTVPQSERPGRQK